MEINVNTYDDLSPRSRGYAEGVMLARGTYDLIISRFAKPITIPKNKTKTVLLRRYESNPRADAPLAEAVTPAGGVVSYTDIKATLEQYGYWVPISDVVYDTHEDDVFDEEYKICGEQIAETKEVIEIGVAKGGTTVFYANSAESRSVLSSPPLGQDLHLIWRHLKKYKAKEIGELIKAGPAIATEPIPPSFFAIGSTYLRADIKNIDGFIPVENYSDATKALPHEVGAVPPFRFILTQLVEPWESAGQAGTTYLSGLVSVTNAANADAFPILIFSQNCFAAVKLQGGKGITPIMVLPKPGIGSPLGQYGFISWKTYLTAVITNQNWLVRYECCATAVPTWS